MNSDRKYIDGDQLRKDLIDYYGTAMTGGFPMAMMDLSKAEKATGEELIKMAESAGLDLEYYIVDE